MRRLPTFAAFLLVLSLVPVCAQRGGGSHGGFTGSPSGSGGHRGMSGRSFGGPVVSGAGFNRPAVMAAGVNRSFSGSRFAGPHRIAHSRPDSGFRGDRFHGRGFEHRRRSRCFGCGYGYGYGYGYPYYSYAPYWNSWWWDSGSSYDEDAARERELAREMNAENLEEQRMLREQDEDSQDQDAYARPARSRPAAQLQEEHVRNDPATVLVFRDQHQREIQNYAIADGILWNFTPQRTEKISLAVLDIPATMRANEDRGIDFRLPRE